MKDITHVYKYQMGGSKEDCARLSLVVPRERTRGNRNKLKYRKHGL